MKQNIMVVSYNYELSKNIAHKLAETFNMRAFDQIELFEFDNLPRTFDEVLKIKGSEYVLKELRSIVKMELDFDNVSFAADISLAETSEDIFYRMKLSNFVIFMFKPLEIEMAELGKIKYISEDTKNFFKTSAEVLEQREKIINEKCADISINVDGLEEDKIIELIEKLIETYYSVG